MFTITMLKTQFKILSTELYDAYCENVNTGLLNKYKALAESGLSMETFSFYTSVSAVFSSKIEGEEIDLDSYVKHKRFGIEFSPDYTRKIDDLYNVYEYAKTAICNEANISNAHKILTGHILPKANQGKIRTGNMYVTTDDGRIEYVAVPPNLLQPELEKFYADLNVLLQEVLTIQEVFFFASMLHLVFVKIHPFDDGNGRTARLIEKWFLSEKLGDKAWLITSERNYYENHNAYYQNIRALGLEYENLDYSKALSFLFMLPNALAKG